MPVATYIETKGSQEVLSSLRQLSGQIMPLTHREIKEDLDALKDKVSKPGPRPTYPINWDSEKQRRAYFATDGFGGGIPYTRTGRYENAWNLYRMSVGYMLVNPLPQAVYISGDENAKGQSRIHQSRWPLWATLVDEYLRDTNKDAERAIEQEARRLGL